MTAPALVLVAPGSREARVSRVATALRAELRQARPDIACEVAVGAPDEPGIALAVSRAVSGGATEVVLVPLDLAHAVDVDPGLHGAADDARRDHPGLAVAVARPVGPEASLLAVLDVRLRGALASARILELDGLVLSAATNGDTRGAALLARRARQWSTHHRLPCLVAVADGTGPSVAHAVAGLRAQGRRHIAVGSLFWAPDEAYAQQSEVAVRAGALAVSEPLGATRELTELLLARYAYAAMDLLDADLHIAGPVRLAASA
ncbi:sirohydrochlorin chelatase [Propioniciclava soli]|uniref:CbiX/SirB N-terminal domain-containing protein n=1 Tax=Propioniciclava soli TaxID=2775081 RepID=A0ABZ3CBA5_9ACTN|nr:CbiX/SirB N-terminal domain-containing protein [Propioniciclava soli]